MLDAVRTSLGMEGEGGFVDSEDEAWDQVGVGDKLRRRETFRVTRGTLLHDLHNVRTQSLLDGI
jgi:hypothetical protein